MKRIFLKSVFSTVMKVFLYAGSFTAILVIIVSIFFFGYIKGYQRGKLDTEVQYEGYLPELIKNMFGIDVSQKVEVPKGETTDTPVPTVSYKPTNIPAYEQKESFVKNVSWGGPDLWEAVNKRRTENGVNPLNQRDDLCTIASIRLNYLIDLGTLDGHEGFSNLSKTRPDLDHIFQNYANMSEFLLVGADSPEEAIGLWENTLAHKKLLTAGEYVWGCVYAQYSFAVAISAF